jgi:gas vesicle protein
MAKAKSVLFGTVFGAIAGFAAGILTAQKSGKETRKDIANQAVKVKDEAVVNGKYAKIKTEETIEDIQDTLDELKVRTKKAAKAAKEEFKK